MDVFKVENIQIFRTELINNYNLIMRKVLYPGAFISLNCITHKIPLLLAVEILSFIEFAFHD